MEIVVNDWSDRSVRDNIMDMYGDSAEPFFGHNQNGESITIHVSHGSIVLETMQNNGWTRKNYYYYNEDTCMQSFNGRWK